VDHPDTREISDSGQLAQDGNSASDFGQILSQHPIAGVHPARPVASLQGRLDEVSWDGVRGWAWDPQTPNKQIRLELVEGNTRLSVVVADRYRQELAQLGCGDGRHGFSIELGEGLLSKDHHVLNLRCADTGAEMPGSPIVAKRVQPSPTGDPVPSSAMISDTSRVNGEHIDRITTDTSERRQSSGREQTWLANQEIALDVIETDAVTPPRDDALRSSPQVVEFEPTLARPVGAADGGPLVDAGLLLKSTDSSAEFWPILRKLSTGGRVRYTVSRSDLGRLRQAKRFLTAGVTASVLALTDSIRAGGSLPSTYFSDSMIAAWLSRADLQQRFQRLDEEVCQYAFLAWFWCVRPIEESLALSCEPTGPILAAMSKVVVADRSEPTARCTALMLAAYCYAATQDGSGMWPPTQCSADHIVEWFFCEGAYDLGMSHAIPQGVRRDLATPRLDCVSPILKWVADRLTVVAPVDLLNGDTPEGIWAWLEDHEDDPVVVSLQDLLRECMISSGQARFDGPLKPVRPAVCDRLRDAVRDRADLLLIDGEPQYMCAGGNGERLLLKDEWYPAEPAFVWSRAPISTVLFCFDIGTIAWFRVGLIFDKAPYSERRMRVILNHNSLWAGTINDASSRELILACTGKCLADDAPNLLQIEVDKAFVPAEHSLSSDHRRLGIGLKRLWVQQAEGQPRK
jgi:hypothetical protein